MATIVSSWVRSSQSGFPSGEEGADSRDVVLSGGAWYDAASWFVQGAISVVALVALSPVLLLIAAAIKITDGGSIFYRGERVGRGKEIFTIFKFRTLAPGAEKAIGARLFSERDRDVLCTRIGRFLKRSKLDELPQLLNVIRGEMRFVGPRPIRPIFLEQFEREIPHYADRFLVPPGITGIAQVRGGYYTPDRQKLRYERAYVQSRGFLLDLQVVLQTAVKVLNRWLRLGAFAMFLLLFVALVPDNLESLFYVSVGGMDVGLSYLFILGLVGWLALQHGSADFSLYRTPLNAAMFLFVLPVILSTWVGDDPTGTLRRGGYYLVTGFGVALVVANTLTVRTITVSVPRLIALTAVLLSALGFFDLVLVKQGVTSPLFHGEAAQTGSLRISSTLANPGMLSAFLVLGVPLVLAELRAATTRGERDFWLVCATLTCLAVIFSDSRVGLVALLVTGLAYFSPNRGLTSRFAALFACVCVLLSLLGSPRYSVPQLRKDLAAWADENGPTLRHVPAGVWFFGGAKPQLLVRGETDEDGSRRVKRPHDRLIPNMHLTLIFEHGIAAWFILVGLVVSVIRAVGRAGRRATDPAVRTRARAVYAALAGFLVSMAGLNTFHNLTLQVYFWSIVGVALGIVVHTGGLRHRLIWRFGDAGD